MIEESDKQEKNSIVGFQFKIGWRQSLTTKNVQFENHVFTSKACSIIQFHHREG